MKYKYKAKINASLSLQWYKDDGTLHFLIVSNLSESDALSNDTFIGTEIDFSKFGRDLARCELLDDKDRNKLAIMFKEYLRLLEIKKMQAKFKRKKNVCK